MLNAAVKSSKIETLIDSVISVDEIRVFKPDPKVYELVVKKYFCKKKEVLFISSNGWDISGASSFGFDTLWINRSNQPIDRLPFKPSNVGVDLTAVTDSVLKSWPRKIGEK
jgi:2-haloacid dehalogenase